MEIEEIRKIAREEAEKVYKDKGTRFGVASVPTHTHNGIDSVKIPAQNVEKFEVLAVNISGSPLGVIGTAFDHAQAVGQGPYYNTIQQLGYGLNSSFVVLPTPTVYGYGAGDPGAFAGGTAPTGTIIYFDNNISLGGLWVRGPSSWYRCPFDDEIPD